jgi:protein-S-isoprenylcysteine O-methyltransferase Ste14
MLTGPPIVGPFWFFFGQFLVNFVFFGQFLVNFVFFGQFLESRASNKRGHQIREGIYSFVRLLVFACFWNYFGELCYVFWSIIFLYLFVGFSLCWFESYRLGYIVDGNCVFK